MSKEVFSYRNQYTADHYARIGALIPKQDKPVIERHYKAKGFNSMSEYLNHLIKLDMGQDK